MTAEEAARVVDRFLYSQYNRERGDLVDIEEYEACFTVRKRPKPEPAADATAPPRPPEPGHSVIVIDKETGGVTFWPSWAMAAVADAYQQAKIAGQVQLLSEWPTTEA
ncbi:hypothetical protein [Actinospica robiniae]|uniref:hypothetical protein n=1 Tax=Actinospica robiniae TaxID=304901 RepID=UPI0012F79F6D|nr:hypothetical protein [Actinospica robiniae]